MNIDNYIQLLEREYGFSIDDENDYLIDQIDLDEECFQETLEVNDEFKEKMVIGIYTKYKNDIIFSYAVSSFSFFKYSYVDILKYMLLSSFFGIKRKYRKLEILKLIHISDYEPLMVVCKTYWLRIIQRHWKRVYEEKRWILDGRRTMKSIRHFELTGRYPVGLNNIPSIHRMLEMYKTK